MRLRPLLITAALTSSLVAGTAFAAVSTPEFVEKASIANMFEIQTSKLALENAKSDQVKAFAQQMIDDHSKTGVKFKAALAASKADAKPAPSLDADHQKQLDSLKTLSGSEFDSKYIALQTDAHKEAVSLFGDYAENGDNAELKRFAGQTLPALKGHLVHVKELNAGK